MQATRNCPTLMICAPASGQGKTTLTAGLARLHTRQGRRVRVFKCGPDFLDPFWLQLASGAPVHQVDLWMTGPDDMAERFWQACNEADLILIEGVMGLLDGQPSAADLAHHWNLPLIALIDASAMAETFGALAYGLMHYRPGLRWAGVLANRVAGASHAAMLRESLREPAHWLGAVHWDANLHLPERHLGLKAAHEYAHPMAWLDAAADVLALTELGAMSLTNLEAYSTCFAPPTHPCSTPELLTGLRIAVARDPAFCFIYEANLSALRQLGAELVFFSPLAGDGLPEADAVWLPGGYPEWHASILSQRHELADQLNKHVLAGKPLWAECGGMMALFDTLVDHAGQSHAMWGLLPGCVRMQERLVGLGMQQLNLPAGALRGHCFHHSVVETSARVGLRTLKPGQKTPGSGSEAVYVERSLRASYFHAWMPSDLHATASLFLPGDFA
jgi:cobyrinic acid a,c-diamide synthase